jgi:hypothetical protein
MNPRLALRGALFLLGISLAACGGSGDGGITAPPPPPPPPPTAANGDISLLFFGNSHTSANGLPEMVGAMVRAARPGRTVTVVEAPNWMFLEERATDAASLALLRSRNWSFVVLQAQKYSSSGQFEYPITGAVLMVRMARGQQATPILFPEWPRLGIPETQRIYDLHLSIARTEPACVPAIPQAFDVALSRHPTLVLHADDGNHSSPAGAFLAALMIANTMTQAPATSLPFIPDIAVDARTQALLRADAADSAAAFPPRVWCPGDPPLP